MAEALLQSQFPTIQAGKLSPEHACWQNVFEDMAANMFVPVSSGVPGIDGTSGSDGRTPLIEQVFRQECLSVPADGSDLVFQIPAEAADSGVVINWFLRNAEGVSFWVEPNAPVDGYQTLHFTSTTGDPIDVPAGSEICYQYSLTRVGYDNDGDGIIDEVTSGPAPEQQ